MQSSSCLVVSLVVGIGVGAVARFRFHDGLLIEADYKWFVVGLGQSRFPVLNCYRIFKSASHGHRLIVKHPSRSNRLHLQDSGHLFIIVHHAKPAIVALIIKFNALISGSDE